MRGLAGGREALLSKRRKWEPLHTSDTICSKTQIRNLKYIFNWVFQFYTMWSVSEVGKELSMKQLSLKSPCVWDLVWPSNRCFIPNLSLPLKVRKIGYHFVKLGISSKICRILFWLRLDFEGRIGAGIANRKLQLKLPWGQIYMRNLVWFPVFFPLCTFFILASHFVLNFSETGAE